MASVPRDFAALALAGILAVALGGCAPPHEGVSTTAGTDDASSEATTGSSSSETAAASDGTSDASTTDPSGTGTEGSSSGSDGAPTDASTTDASTTDATDSDTGEPPTSLCVQTPETITCPHETVELQVSLLVDRAVHYQTPLGEPPASGWPVAFMFQGSLFTSELSWVGHIDGPFGMYFQTLTLKRLLDAGYAVITPESHLGGATFWDTNVPPYTQNWAAAPDHEFMLAIFEALEQGVFGPLDPSRWYATGISSGGYMTSRMAVSYHGKFRALAIASASYATCSGPLCLIPPQEPSHEPTLFLHGELDAVVPIATMYDYADALQAAGVEHELVVDPAVGHAWIPAAPDAVLTWFMSHP